MKIIDNVAELTRKEQRVFGIGGVVLVSELPCSEKLAALCTERDRLYTERKDLKFHPAAHAYHAPIQEVEHAIEIATNVGGVILVHEIEQYLFGDRPPEQQS